MAAARRPTVALALAVCAAVALLRASAFAGLSASAPARGARVARSATYEIMVTNPSVGARCRLNINEQTTV
eukprot:CAMPEP_0177380440 /NCGR_PEP_ID=MMETSP0368-20130122/47515_1 /TAXON_ID=447022 ORGANISM="Scrippsiella hangoei-like, Strain SHHI-4" /NCGR_SAMPLE_ID=MMETSP0368 /ASSEMBLY_ACC=CAM_ASM_000363 /LENGTH=70 /DNA_ID=CAMNT_0018844749 /DNA_START=23 /DNA_END=231 /DNA_ORIENTATION=-